MKVIIILNVPITTKCEFLWCYIFSHAEEIQSLLMAILNYMAQHFSQIDNLSIKSAFQS